MNVIILAAGKGTRLSPFTDNKPKCMVELFGKSLIEFQLSSFEKFGINDISIVTGYKSDSFNFKNVNYFHNSNYEITNMVETLFCAIEKFNETVIVSYGDIIFEDKVLQKLIDSEEDFSIIVDKNWRRYWEMRNEDPLEDAESLEVDTHGNISSIGQKVEDITKIQGQYIGLMKFQGRATNAIKNFYKRMKNEAKKGKNPLNPNLPFEKSYMTDLLNGLIKDGLKLKAIEIENGWLELDTVSDYELYEKMEKDHKLSEFFKLGDN